MEVMTFCALPFQRLKITSEGNATVCCFQERKCLGNVLETGLEAMWKGAIVKEIREMTAKGELHPTCNTPSCPFFHLKTLVARPITPAIQFPRELELDLPMSHCNIGGEIPDRENPACLMCERHRRYEPMVDRLDEICALLRPHMGQVRNLHIQGIAEPFWKDRIFEILDMLGALDHKHTLQLTSTTNGTILNEARRRKFLEYPNSWMTFSIDAATPKTFKLIRRLDLYDKVIENMSNYCIERKPGQKVKIHNNINLLNLEEGPAMVEAASVSGVDLIEFNPTYGTEGICVDESNVHLFRQAQKDIAEAGNRLNMPIWFMRDFDLEIEQKFDFVKLPIMPRQIKAVAESLWVNEGELLEFARTSKHVDLIPDVVALAP